MDLNKTIYQVLSKYFKYEDMKISMTFQAKYLGMSPWNCPGTFSMLSYVKALSLEKAQILPFK